MANYSCKKLSPCTYALATIYLLQTDRQTNRRTHHSMDTLQHGCST